MEEQLKEINDLIAKLNIALDKIGLDNLKKEYDQLKLKSLDQKIWSNIDQAQMILKRLDQLNSEINQWQDFQKGLIDLQDLINLKDNSLINEINQELARYRVQMEESLKYLRFNQPYDSHDAIFSIFAGAGGVDAQDWTTMLLRMYTRFFDSQHFHYFVINQNMGEEAGIKSVTLSVEGKMVYGSLRSEDGVHRLVRLSPFNADHLRQTSFSKVEVMPKINLDSDLDLNDNDLRIDVFRSGGHGGQSVNTTDSAVRITHLPTGISVSIQNERSQLQNKQLAMEVLKAKLVKIKIEQHVNRLNEIKGSNISAEWGNQIRNYVLHPYKLVKDLRTKYEDKDVEAVLDGRLQPFIDSYLNQISVK
jgi:peptide chain release factor 2